MRVKWLNSLVTLTVESNLALLKYKNIKNCLVLV